MVLSSQLFEELQSHSSLDDPHPKPHSPRPDFDPFLTRFRTEFDPISTPNRPKRSESGQIQVEIGSERGSKSGRGEWGLGVGVHPGRSGSAAPSNSPLQTPSAIGSEIARPYLGLSRIHTQVGLLNRFDLNHLVSSRLCCYSV